MFESNEFEKEGRGRKGGRDNRKRMKKKRGGETKEIGKDIDNC